MNKRTILTAATFLVLSSVTALPVYAQTPSPSPKPNFLEQLIDMISQKFGLDKTQVQSVVTDWQSQKKQTMQTNMQNREKIRLDKLVSQNKITADQENLILQKLQDLQNNRQNLKNMTPDQRKQAMQQERTDLQNWAKQNNIDPQYLMPGFGMGKGRGFGFRGGLAPKTTPAPTT